MPRHLALIGPELEENLALRCIRSAVEAAGHRVTLLAFEDEAQTGQVARALAASGADMAGLSMVFTRRAREFARLARCAREQGYEGTIVAGGHFAAFHAEALLRDVPAIDAVVRGEGEGPLALLLDGPADPAAVPGLTWRDGDRIVHNAPAAKPADLDLLPPPAHKQPPDRIAGLAAVNLLSSRGCSHACAFCSIAAWHRLCGGERLRLRSPEAVAAEVAGLYHSGVRVFNFHDDNFFLALRDAMLARVDALACELARRGVGRIAIAAKCRPDAAFPEVLEALQRLGLFRVFLGIEAGSAVALRQLGRGQRLADNVAALRTVNALGLHATFNLLLFNPDSTLEDVADNVAFLREHPDNPANFCRTEVYAGTPLEARLRRQGRLEGDYWGWSYTIADPRAEAAFQVARVAFARRCFALDGLHHRSMQLDFEHQRVEHFQGRDAALRQAVKRFVREVNLDTAAQLDALVRELKQGAPGDPAALARAVSDRVARADAGLAARASELLGQVRLGARRAASPWLGGGSCAAPAWRRASRCSPPGGARRAPPWLRRWRPRRRRTRPPRRRPRPRCPRGTAGP